MYKFLKKSLLLATFIISNLAATQTFANVCGIVTTNTDPLNIRKNSSQTAKVISKAVSGSALRILGVQGAWYKVKLNNGKIGYGSIDYIKELTSSSEEACGIVTTNRDPLIIREYFDKNAKIISKVARGSALHILSSEGMWYTVKLNNGQIGFGNANYINIKDFTLGSQKVSMVCGIVTTNSDPLNIRKDSSQTAKVISKAVRGSALRILSIQGTWYKVKLNNGKTGYGSIDYIKELTPRSQEKCGIITTNGNSLSIRKKPNQYADMIGKAVKGSALRVMYSSGMWYEILLNNGEVGYANSDYVN